MKITHNPDDTVTIELEFIEVIGLYKLALAVNHPGDAWAQPAQLQSDEDVGPLSAALQVQLAAVVGP
jgi:hypothetical protein